MSFLAELSNVDSSSLAHVDAQSIMDRSNVNVLDQTSDELEDEAKHWDAFFQSSCTSWFEHIKQFTFSSSFCTLLPGEAKVIVDHWGQLRQLRARLEREGSSPEYIIQEENKLYAEATSKLELLQIRLEKAISTETALSPVGKAFVKLTTRSPKDSKKALHKAKEASEKRFSNNITSKTEKCSDSMWSNNRWRILCEEVADACAVSTAAGALELLLDSERVYEDLEFALRGKPKASAASRIDSNGSSHANESVSLVEFDDRLGLVARSWDPRLKPESEFRGICQDGVLTCLCQYFHPLLFPELPDKVDEIQKDIFELFHNPKVAAAVSSVGNNCIIDFAWLGSGDVMIIELNPFDGVCLGVFPASTGLFLWDTPSDRAVMTGQAPFEFRYRTEVLPRHTLLSQCSKDWASIIYPTKKSSPLSSLSLSSNKFLDKEEHEEDKGKEHAKDLV